jgi:PhnB protein
MSQTLIQPYLFFSGRFDEALAFYQRTIGAEVVMLMRYDESPDPVPPGMLPAGWEKKVMHCTLKVGTATMMASDGCVAEGGFSGFSLSLAYASEAEARQAFAALSEGGKVEMPIGRTFWSSCFGMLTDRYGVGWMISVIPGA